MAAQFGSGSRKRTSFSLQRVRDVGHAAAGRASRCIHRRALRQALLNMYFARVHHPPSAVGGSSYTLCQIGSNVTDQLDRIHRTAWSLQLCDHAALRLFVGIGMDEPGRHHY